MASHMENENENENEIENDIENAVERAENPEIFFGEKCAISVSRKRAKETRPYVGEYFVLGRDRYAAEEAVGRASPQRGERTAQEGIGKAEEIERTCNRSADVQ